MRCIESQMAKNRFGWNNQRNYWCFIAIFVTILGCCVTFALVSTLFIYMQPGQYIQAVQPIFQSHKTDQKKLLTVYQNSAIKNQLCSCASSIYTGNILDKDQFCNLKYQSLPLISRPFDVTIEGLNFQTIKFVKICMFKKGLEHQEYQSMQVQDRLQQIDRPLTLSNTKYLCQKYRVDQNVRIGNYIQLDDIFFMIIQLEINQKESKIGKVEAKLIFQQQISFLFAIWVDYYFWISCLIILAVTAWMTVVLCAISFTSYIKLSTQRRKQQEELIKLRRCKGE